MAMLYKRFDRVLLKAPDLKHATSAALAAHKQTLETLVIEIDPSSVPDYISFNKILGDFYA